MACKWLVYIIMCAPIYSIGVMAHRAASRCFLQNYKTIATRAIANIWYF